MPRKQSLNRSTTRISRLIHSTLDFDEIMARVLSEAAQAVGSETAAVSLRQDDQWVVSHVHGFPSDVVGTRMDDRQEPHAVLAIRTRKPVVINDAFTDERVNREHMKQWGIRSVLVVPLVTEEQVVGVLFFNQHRAATPFEEHHVEFAGQLASSLSLAVRNARLFQNLRRELAQRQDAEQALQETNERLQVQTEELQTQTEELRAQEEELQAQTEELRANEQALRDSEQLARDRLTEIEAIYNSAHVGLCVFDRELRYLRINERLAEINGIPAVRHLGRTPREIVPDLADTAEKLAERVFRTGEPVLNVELSGTTAAQPGVPRRWIEHWLPLKDARGEVVAVSIVAHEITERKQAEGALRRGTERFKLLSETAGRLLEAENPQEVINELCRRVMEHLDCQVFFNYLLDERTDRLHLNACAGIPQKEARKIEWLDCGVVVCGCVARDGRRIVAEDIPTTRDPRTEFVASYGIQAYACHPLLAHGRVIGTLSFGTRTRTRFREEELSLMKIVADQVAVAIQRMQTQEALRQAHEELQAQSEELTVANGELRVQSEQLHQSEQRLRMALEGGQMGRWEWDLVTDSMFWCERTYALLGLDTFRPAGTGLFLDRIHADDRQAVEDLLARAMNEGQNFQAEFRVVRHGQEQHGEVVWLALHAQVIRNERRQAVRTIGVLYDITARKEMEDRLRRLNEGLEEEVRAQTEELRATVDRLQDEAVRRVQAEGRLRESSRLLEAFFQHTIAPLAFLDRRFRFVRVNEAFARAEGQAPEFFVDRDYFALYPRAEDRAIFEQVVQTKQPYHAEARLFAFSSQPRQDLRYWNWQITPLLDEAGEVQFLVFNLEDVTERQKAFGELEHRAALLQKLTLELTQAEDRERRRLAEILHDDLQQVLAAAKFHLGLLNSRLKGDDTAQELAGQLTRMIKEAIEKSRSLSHELSPSVLYQSDLGETFEWLARQVQTKHGLTVHTEVHGRVDASSEAVKAFLFRAAQEVLFNTVKHAQVPEARLRLQKRRGRLWLTIADRGRGFDPGTLGRTAGFGLLSIRERVELLGGRMKIRSARGRGSTFLITVPDTEAEAGTPGRVEEAHRALASGGPAGRGPAEARAGAGPAGRPLRILLVDDHKVMRAGLAVLIGEQPDMEVVGQAGDGRRAVELAGELAPDVVIMDVAMPMMPGDEATRRIKAALPHTRVIGLSMFEEASVARKMHEAGAEVYLAKTGPSEGLLNAIRGQS